MTNYEIFLEKANKLHGNYTFKEETFITQQVPMIAVCKLHGDFEIIPRYILKSTKIICNECLKLEALQNFITKASEVHNNKFDYSLVDYVNARANVSIICPRHGEFSQRASSHLNGDGCPDCGKELKIGSLLSVKKISKEDLLSRIPDTHKHIEIDISNYTTQDAKDFRIVCPEHGEHILTFRGFLKNRHGCPECTEDLNGWSKSNFIKRAKRNGNAILYIIKCFNDTEEFYKIGITTNNVKKRYASKQFPYSYEIIHEISDKASTIWDLEKLLLKVYKKYQYIPYIPFGGFTECFQLP